MHALSPHCPTGVGCEPQMWASTVIFSFLGATSRRVNKETDEINGHNIFTSTQYIKIFQYIINIKIIHELVYFTRNPMYVSHLQSIWIETGHMSSALQPVALMLELDCTVLDSLCELGQNHQASALAGERSGVRRAGLPAATQLC